MAMKTSISIFTIFFVVFLVISEAPEIEAQDSKCLKEYGGNVGFRYCAPRIFPTFCDRNCRNIKGAKSGVCRTGAGGVSDMKCLCNYCSGKP